MKVFAKGLIVLCLALLLAGCGTTTAEPVRLGENRLFYQETQQEVVQNERETSKASTSQERVRQEIKLHPRPAASLLGESFAETRQALFSPPDWVRYEGDVALWQYRGATCVLDAVFWRDEASDLFAGGDVPQQEVEGADYSDSASPHRLRYLETRDKAGAPADPDDCLADLRHERAEVRLAQ